MPEEREKCVKPSRGPIGSGQTELLVVNGTDRQEEPEMVARVGKPAPDFELSAFFEGGFKNIRLSEFRGKWIVLCFYPGDFTFV